MRKERIPHDNKPKNHILKVHTGRFGSSVLGTVSRTSSMGETSLSSASSMVFSGSESLAPLLVVPSAAVVVVEEWHGVCCCRVAM